MKKTYWYLACVIYFCSSCSNQNNKEIDSFTDVKDIVEFDSIYSDKNNPLGFIASMDVFNKILITKHGDDELFFSFIDVERGQLRKRWGHKGKGKDEYIQLGPGCSIHDSTLVFTDDVRCEINYVPIKNVLNNLDLDIRKETYPYTQDFRPFYIDIVGKQKIVTGGLADGRFGIIDSLGHFVYSDSNYPFDIPEEIQGIYRGAVFQSVIKSNEKLSKFVIHTIYSDIFEIYKMTTNGIHRVSVSSFKHIPQIKKAPNMNRYAIDAWNSIVGLTDMAVSDSLIAFLYSKELCKDFREGSRQIDTVLCFDWNGNKVVKYKLPFGINGICLDSEYIYGYRYNEGETVFYRFKM